jgi:hypothetical protein
MIGIFSFAIPLYSHSSLHVLAQYLMEIYFIRGFAFLLDEPLEASPV